MDNTLVDEMGKTLRPGIEEFLSYLVKLNYELILWTNSSKSRAQTILSNHNLNKYFKTYIYREDYDPKNTGNKKDIRMYKADFLIDDDPDEINNIKRLGLNGFLIKSYRQNTTIDKKEYAEILKALNKNWFFNKGQ